MKIVKVGQVEPTSRFPGVFSRPLLNPDQGSAAVTMSELTIQPGATLPRHSHLAEEAFFVVQGKGEALGSGESSAIGAGMALLAPAGSMHGFRNTGSEDLKVICMYPVVNPVAFFPEEK